MPSTQPPSIPSLVGPSSGRPSVPPGQTMWFYDSKINKMIYWNGTHWADLTGTQVSDWNYQDLTGFSFLASRGNAFVRTALSTLLS